MNDMIVHNPSELPSKIDDLARFVLVGREKLVALRAEIRAIDKLKLAKEVEQQKREESRQLADLILLATVRIGELTKQMPTAQGMRSDMELRDSVVPKSQTITKQERIEALGFTKKQVQRFETLASHPEHVEKARETATAENRPVTQTEVLNLAKYREEKSQAEYRQIDEDCRLAQLLTKALTPIKVLPIDKDSIAAMRRGDGPTIDGTRDSLRKAIQNLLIIQREYERR